MKKYALVVGVKKYEDPEVTDLEFAARDAEKMAEALREHCAFDDVRALYTGGPREPVHTAVYDTLRNLAPLVTPDDLFLFYFAGHGLYCRREDREEANNRAYLLTANTYIHDVDLASLEISVLRRYIARLDCRQRVLVLDSCRNNPHQGMGDEDNLLDPSFAREISLTASAVSGGPTPATCVLFSCSKGERAWPWPEKEHGVFTHFLLEGLAGKAMKDGPMTVQKLCAYTEAAVGNWARKMNKAQTPCSEQSGSIREIVLSGEKAAQVRPAARVENGPATLVVPDVYASVQAAVDAARPGDTVRLRGGVYEGPVVITRDINLIGENRDTVTIRCGAEEDHALTVRDAKSLVSGITFEHTGSSDRERRFAVLALRDADAEVFRCTIQNGGGNGVSISKGSPALRENVIRQNGWSGLYASGAETSVLIRDNVFRSNKRYGMYFGSGASGTAERNTCEDNESSGIASFDAGTYVTLTENTCRKNGKNGISFNSSASGTAERNTCEDNESCGIASFQEGTSVTLTENACRKNSQHGISFNSGASGTAERNTCEDNEWTGITSHREGTSVALTENACRKNSQYGIAFESGASGTAERNTCEDNEWSGIAVVHAETTATLRHNICKNNKDWGIAVDRRAKTEEHGNEAQGNGRGDISHEVTFKD